MAAAGASGQGRALLRLAARLSGAPACAEGILNLRGQVNPIIDKRKRLGLAPMAPDTRSMVFALAVAVIGFLGDTVSGVRRIPASMVDQLPAVAAGGML